MRGITIGRVAGGRVVELWDDLDDLGLLTQLGVFPVSIAEPEQR